MMVFTWDVACPTCDARPHKRCKNSHGERAKFHVARTRAAAKAQRGAKVTL